MENLRFFRLTIPGWMLLLSIVVFNYSFFGENNIYAFMASQNSHAIISILIVILGSSVIGLMISIIAYSLIHAALGYYFYFSTQKHYYKLLIQALISFNVNPTVKEELENLPMDSFKINILKRKSRREIKTIFDYYQVFLREKMKPEVFQYTQRAWDFFYLNFNNLIAIVVGLFVSISVNEEVVQFHVNIYFILIVLFSTSSCWHLLKCRKDAIKLEENWLKTIELS